MSDHLLDRVVTAVGDRYDVELELGRGGAGVVYRAMDVRLRRRVALKVLPPDLAFRTGIRERFLHEAQTAAQLSHPNIVSIFSVDEVDGLVYFAMALVEGETLGHRLTRQPRLPIPEARRILSEVADALAYAHRRGVVHRDVKPENILLDRESGRAMVSDFGIARAVEADLRLTVTGVAVGTPAYMSPEQALGERELDGRSDIYSLGVVGYQMLAGELPFHATTAAAMLMKHVGERPRPLAQLRPDVPSGLASAIETALAKKPEARWADATAFRSALQEGAFAPPIGADQRAALVHRAESRAEVAGRPLPPAVAPSDDGQPLSWREARKQWDDRRNAERERWRTERERVRDEARARREEWPGGMGDWHDAQRGGGVPARIDGRQGGLAPQAAGRPVGGEWEHAQLERRADGFRRKFFGSFALLCGLAVINVVTDGFPWVIFPAFGMIMALVGRWGPLGSAGLRLGDVLAGGSAAVARRDAWRGGWQMLETTVARFRRRAFVSMGLFAVALPLFIVGAAANAEEIGVPGLLAGFVAFGVGASALRYGFRARTAGLRMRVALSKRWREAVAALDPRPRETRVREEAARLVDDAVLRGPHGATVLGAVDDGLTVRETLAKLSTADHALIPDVQPTVKSLVERVASLAQSLHRLDHDVRPGQLEELDARLVAARALPLESTDRERKLQLLERQRASVADLIARRAGIAAQLESALLVLQTIKLDLVKLRSAGIGATGDLSAATQEARALSQDIKYAIEAAGEVRGM